MAKLDLSCIKSFDAQQVIKELVQWQGELDSSVIDSIIYNTLDTVIDIIIDNCEEI